MKPVTPILVVDIIIEVDGGIVLIERKNEPRGWALPGGCVDVGETCRAAAIREAREETGLEIENVRFLGLYDDPDRDPRGHAVSVAYICTAKGTPVAADDAKASMIAYPHWENLRGYPSSMPAFKRPTPICFDHNDIIADYLRLKAKEL